MHARYFFIAAAARSPTLQELKKELKRLPKGYAVEGLEKITLDQANIRIIETRNIVPFRQHLIEQGIVFSEQQYRSDRGTLTLPQAHWGAFLAAVKTFDPSPAARPAAPRAAEKKRNNDEKKSVPADLVHDKIRDDTIIKSIVELLLGSPFKAEAVIIKGANLIALVKPPTARLMTTFWQQKDCLGEEKIKKIEIGEHSLIAQATQNMELFSTITIPKDLWIKVWDALIAQADQIQREAKQAVQLSRGGVFAASKKDDAAAVLQAQGLLLNKIQRISQQIQVLEKHQQLPLIALNPSSIINNELIFV